MPNTQNENKDIYIEGDKKTRLVDWMRKEFPDITSTIKQDSSIYKLAQEYYPDYEYEPWDEDEYSYDYNSDAFSVDTSPDTLNSFEFSDTNVQNLVSQISDSDKVKIIEEHKKDPNLNIWDIIPSETGRQIGKVLSLTEFGDELNKYWSDNIARLGNIQLGDIAMHAMSDERKKSLHRRMNESTAGLSYRARNDGEDKYKVDDRPVLMGGTVEYNPGVIENITNSVLSLSTADVASFYIAGNIMKAVNPKVGSTVLKAVENNKVFQWMVSRTPEFVKKTLPNTKVGRIVKDNIFKNFDKYKAADQMVTIGQMNGMVFSYHGAVQSYHDQTLGLGKYKDKKDGTVNPWDMAVDMSKYYGEGVAIGSVIGFSNNIFDSAFKYTSSLANKNASKINMVKQGITSPVSKYASHGITYTTMPLLWDKERRKTYIDKNGNINFSKYWADVTVMGGYSLVLVGASQSIGNLGNAKRYAFEESKLGKKYVNYKTLRLNKEEIKMLRNKWTESQRAAIGKGQKDVTFEDWIKSLDKGQLANLMRGKAKVSVNLWEKLTSNIGFRPKSPWRRNAKIFSEPLPDNINLPKVLKNIQNNLKEDIVYENNKKTNTNLQSNQAKLLTESLNNVSADLKGKVPYEFFEKTITDLSESVDMGDGLKSIYEIANKSLEIMDRISIKNDKGEIIGVNNGKATDDDIFFLQAYAPSVIPAYQGYRDTYLNSDEGQEAYITRYEVEKNVKLNNKQRKLLIDVAKSQNEQLDEIRDYLNRAKLEGFGENEQSVIKNKNQNAPIATKYEKVILLDESGLPVTGEVLSLNKLEADKLISLNRAMKVSFAKNKNIPTGNSQNNSLGDDSRLAKIEKMLKSGTPAKLDTQISEAQHLQWIDELEAEVNPVTWKTESIGNNVLQTRIENIVNKKNNRIIPDRVIEGINDVIDIKVISQLPEKTLLEIKKHNINRLLIDSGKDSFSEITTDDIVDYFNKRIADKKKKKYTPVLSDDERSSFFRFFKALEKKGAIIENPYDKNDKRIMDFASDYNDLRPIYKKQNVGIVDFFQNIYKMKDIASSIKKLSNIKNLTEKDIKDLKKISKETKIPLKALKNDKGRISTVLDLFYKSPIRDQEINAIKPTDIFKHDDGTWYIDLRLPRRLGGGRKKRGTPRALPIPEDLALKIINHGKELQMMREEIFPNYAGLVTKILQSTLGTKSTAKEFKSQLKQIAEQQAGLLPDAAYQLPVQGSVLIDEKQMYGILAGHATKADDKITKFYTEQQNLTDFFEIAKQVTDKVNKRIDVILNPPKSNIPVAVPSKPQTPVAGKIVGKVLSKKPPKLGLSIEDIKGKSDKQIVQKVTDANPPKLSKTFLKEYRKAIIKEFNRQSVGMSVTNKEELLLYYADKASISNFTEFNLKEATYEELIAFSKEILVGKQEVIEQKKIKSKTLSILDKADALADRANISMDERKDILRLKFRKTSKFSLTLDEAKEYLTEMALNQDAREVGVWRGTPIDGDTFSELASKISVGKAARMTNIHGGQFKAVMTTLEDKYGIKGAKDLAHRALNHVVWEHEVQNYLTQFETEAFRALADNKLTFNPRQVAGKYNIGKRKFTKIKKHLWWLQEDQWFGLKKFVETYPEQKNVVKIYNDAKKFMDKIYDKKGVLRIDTPESYVARAWYRMTNRIKESYIRGLKANMTEMQYKTFMKEHGIKWIEKTFYMSKSLNSDFIAKANLTTMSLQKELDKNIIPFATDRAYEKHGKGATLEQIEAEKDAAKIEILNTLAISMKYNSPSKTKARYLLERKLNLPPFLLIEGKPVQVWDTSYDTIGNKGVAGQGKVSATIRWFPEFADLKGLPGNFKNMPKLVAELHLKAPNEQTKIIADYIKQMIHSRIGIRNINMPYYPKKTLGYVAQTMHFLNKSYLSWYTSALKNAGLGTTMNVNIWSDQAKDLAVNMARALDFETRLDAKGKGLISLALSAIETEGALANVKINDFLFNLGGFQQSEVFTRLVSALMALVDSPKMVDVLQKSPILNYKLPASSIAKGSPIELINVINKATEIYDLNDEEIYLAQRYGLNSLDASQYLGDRVSAKRFDITQKSDIVTFEGKTLTSAYDIANEISKLNELHQKIITMAHINSQGATAEVLQHPIFLNPWAGGAFQFQKMAASHVFNMMKIIRMNKKNKNLIQAGPSLLKLAGTATAGAGFTGWARVTLAMLLRTAANEGELDDKHWKIMLRYLIIGEWISLATPALKIFKGEMPQASDFVPLVPYVKAYEVMASIFDIAKGTASKLGLKMSKGTPLQQQILYKKLPMQNLTDLVLNTQYFVKNVVKMYTNIKHPYNILQEDIKNFEKIFLQSTPTTKANIKSPGIATPYNFAVSKSFNESDNIGEITERMIEKYEVHYTGYKKDGKTDKEAENLALIQCEDLLNKLCPLSIGTDRDGRVTNLSKDEEFILFLTKRAYNQMEKRIIKTKDPLIYVKKVFKGVDEYKVKRDTVVDTLRFKLRKNYKDKDYVQKLHNIKKSNLKELGFITDKNGKTILDPRIKKALDDFIESRK